MAPNLIPQTPNGPAEPPEGALPRQPERIETDRLVLRRYRDDDATAIAAALSQAPMSWNMGRIPSPYTLDDAREFLSRAEAEHADAHAICVRGEGETLVGACAIAWRAPDCRANGGIEPEVATLGYWIALEHWGKGYASEAVAAKLAEHFGRGGAKVHARAFTDNPASLRVLAHVGFRDVGTAFDTNLVRGEPAPVRLTECTADDFRGAAWNVSGGEADDGSTATTPR